MNISKLLGLSLVISSCMSVSPNEKKKEIGEKFQTFEVQLIDSVTQVNISNVLDNKPFVIVYFSPDCPVCKAEIEAILADTVISKQINFCLITYPKFADYKRFYTDLKLEKYPAVFSGIDITNKFLVRNKIKNVPYIQLYKNERLESTFIGMASIDTIRKTLLGKI